MLKKTMILILVCTLAGCAQNPNRTGSIQTQAPPVYELTHPNDIRLLQQRLQKQGFDPHGIDGKLGPNTKMAISRFQKTRGYPVDGRATSLLLQQLDPSYVPPSAAQKHYDDSLVGESTAVSAGVGAAVGAAAGAIFGGKKGALIGAASGAVIGAGVDVGANAVRVNQAETEQQLNLSLDQIRRENAQLKQKIDLVKQVVEEDKRKIRQLNSRMKSKTLSAQEAKRRMAELDQSRKQLQEEYDGLVAKQKQWQAYSSTNGNDQAVDREIEQLNAEIASLKLQLDELDQLRSISISG